MPTKEYERQRTWHTSKPCIIWHTTEADDVTELRLLMVVELIDDDNDAHHDRYFNDWEG